MAQNTPALKFCFWLFQNLQKNQKSRLNWFKRNYLVKSSFLVLVVSGSVLAQDGDIEQIPKEDSIYRAQTDRGNWAVGGSFAIGAGFENNKVAFINNKLLVDMTGSARVGRFVLPSVMLGLSYHVLTTNFLLDFQNEFQVLSQYGGGCARVYIRPGFFGEAYYGVGVGFARRMGQASYQEHFISRKASIGIGLALFWFDKTHFEFQIKYHHYQADAQTPFEVGGLGIHAGMMFCIKPKNKNL